MTIEQPNISDNARMNLTQASKALEINTKTFKKYAAMLGIFSHNRAVGGSFYIGKDVKRIWLRIA